MRRDATRPATMPIVLNWLRRAALIALTGAIAACGASDPLEEDLPDMGNFRLAYNIVVADNMQQVPPSREASADEWEAILTSEIDRRFGGYEGEKLYHLGIAVDGYALAPPGIPIVLNPRSVLVVSVNVWDDALGAKLHEEPEQILIFEGSSPETFLLGSGMTRTREEQMQSLARNAARRIQLWMLRNPEWFDIDPDAARAAAAEVEQVAEAAETPVDAGAATAGEAADAPAVAAGDPADAAAAATETCVPTADVICPEPLAN